MTATAHVFFIPVLIGGPGAGTPIENDRAIWRFQHPSELGEDRTATYTQRKFAARGSRRAVRFAAWAELSDGDAMSLAWDWLIDRAERGVESAEEPA